MVITEFDYVKAEKPRCPICNSFNVCLDIIELAVPFRQYSKPSLLREQLYWRCNECLFEARVTVPSY